MTSDEMNKLGKDSMDMAMNSFGTWSKSGQAIVAEVVYVLGDKQPDHPAR